MRLRLYVIAILNLGYLAILMGILKAVFMLTTGGSPDNTFDYWVHLWENLQLDIGIIAACASFLKPLVGRILKINSSAGYYPTSQHYNRSGRTQLGRGVGRSSVHTNSKRRTSLHNQNEHNEFVQHTRNDVQVNDIHLGDLKLSPVETRVHEARSSPHNYSADAIYSMPLDTNSEEIILQKPEPSYGIICTRDIILESQPHTASNSIVHIYYLESVLTNIFLTAYGQITACCVGHEIVGKAIRVVSNANDIKVGDRVGVGPQAYSCMNSDCPRCSSGQYNYCSLTVATYASIYPDGSKSYGRYSDYPRTYRKFVFEISDGLPSEFAAPMLCASITVYSPLRRHACGPGKRVGIVGVGGLGHFAILFAKAPRANKVIVISRKATKKDTVLALGADDYIATDDDARLTTKNARSLDIIICTASSDKMPLENHISMFAIHGKLIQVGASDGGNLPHNSAFARLGGGRLIGGSNIGSPEEIKEMLQLAVDKRFKP
ncbi:alcohol dehydrogenase nadp+ [Trichoderma arundinaceum]|uniref:Alcohol dehydrogenase nadp n=1 Tax=Trichoderma arundinaceum TaxID=490622 RepID=A0A395NBM2_TRIAR|nr:alcohol dehydrogenase nadp+ [Trichoderma arundinaceum]